MKDSDWEFLKQLYLTPNITKTANALFVSQPALSKRLQSIEDEMHVKIVLRNKNGLDFTEEGRYLAQQAIKYIDFLEETRRHLSMMRSKHSASISIGASLSYLTYELPEIISEYTKLHPDIRFDIIGGRSRAVCGMVEDGSVDFGIIRGQIGNTVEKLHVNTEAGYIVTDAPLKNLKSLASTPRIDYPLNSYCRQLVDDWWRAYFPSAPVIGMTVEHMNQTFPMVSQNLGYSICFLPNNRRIQSAKPLHLTPLVMPDGTPLSRPTWLIYQAKRQLTPELTEFLNYFRENVAEKKDPPPVL